MFNLLSSFMKSIKYAIIISVLVLSVSCSTSQSSLNDLRELTAQVNDEGSTYGIREWQHTIKKYTKVDKKIIKYAAKGKYSDYEMEEIGRLQAGCVKGFAKCVGLNIGSKINGVQSLFKGWMDSFINKEREE